MSLFAGFGRRHVTIAIGFAVLIQFTHAWYGVMGKGELRPGPLLSWALIYFCLALIALACAVATDNVMGESARPAARMLVALLAAAALTTLAVELLFYVLPTPIAAALEGDHGKGFVSDLHRIAHSFSVSAGWSLLLVPAYSMQQANRRATAQLHRTRLAALAAERQVVEADLRAMQARVEPDLLFSALVAVDEAYGASVEDGERALDALIAFLRAALPSESASTSTVAAELDLLRAYVGVRELVGAPKLALDIAAEPATRTQPMPAMLLLPVARWALDGAPAGALQVVARRAAGALEITLRSDLAAPPAHDGGDIADIRERLAHLYGERARLEARDHGTERHALIALPA